MRDDLLENARRQAERVDPPLRAAALLRIARAESAADSSRARRTLLEGLDVIRNLPTSVRENLLEEARTVAAAVSPELLADIPITQRRGVPERFAHFNIVQAMLAHGHLEAAFDYLLHNENSSSFPFPMVGNVLYHLDLNSSESAARRLMLLRHAVDMWRQGASGRQHHEHNHFVHLFGDFWKEFPSEEALDVARMIVARATEEPDTVTSAAYANEVHFTSPRQNTLFQILHVLRHLDPASAQSLIDSHDQLSLATRRYPNGLETINEEGKAEAERRKADGAACGGGYILAGDPRDFDRQRRLIDATRSGNFEPSIEDAIEKYRQDTSPATRNYAPKEYWPSTGAFRTVFYQAGRRLGTEAAKLLEQIPDDDLRLFATIELAAALAGAPESSITHMKQPNPPGSSESRGGRIVAARSSRKVLREGSNGSTMRSPDGRLIRCPRCLFRPCADLSWNCKCGHIWNTFWTSGLCPACHFQWEVTQCPHCGEMSEHQAWYTTEP